MAEPPKNGVRKVVFLTKIDFSNMDIWQPPCHVHMVYECPLVRVRFNYTLPGSNLNVFNTYIATYANFKNSAKIKTNDLQNVGLVLNLLILGTGF